MKIRVVENVLKANDTLAQENRQRLDRSAVRAINLMSAPGSGKTTLLEKTITQLGSQRCAVLVGDLQTTRDAERLEKAGSQTIQINTGKGCHLSAAEVARGLDELALDKVDYLFIENVGNMVCPAGFDLGEHQRVALLSIPEGDDKVAKYWTLFQSVDAILLTKMDLLEVLDFDISRVKADLAHINTAAPFMELSSKTGKGMEQWFKWLKNMQD